jgi:ferredoxin
MTDPMSPAARVPDRSPRSSVITFFFSLINSAKWALLQPKTAVDQRNWADEDRHSALVIDWTRCDGHGLCAALLPEHISRDEWGFPVLHTTGFADRDARRVAAACPALALRVIRHDE